MIAVAASGQAQKPGVGENHHHMRHYEAGAYVSLLSVHLFTRNGVGYGYAKADEDVSGESRSIGLEFLSGSIPEHAHGLNRFGFIQENVREVAGKLAEADYLGLMTANPEESLLQAKAALNAAPGAILFSAAQATIARRIAHFAVRHFMMDSGFRSLPAGQLMQRARASFERAEEGQPEHSMPLTSGDLDTFLYSVRAATVGKAEKMQLRFLYNGKFYRLTTEKRDDARVGLELQQAGLVGPATTITRLNGVIQNEKTSETTNFHLWFERNSEDWLPLRFDFRPKPYLRLVFQATAEKR